MHLTPADIRPFHSFFLALALMLVLATACERERIVDPGPDEIAPLPPAALLVESARDGYIFISWIRNKEIDLRGYIVYRAEESDPSRFVAVDTTTLFYFIDEQRSYDTTYSYFVTAFDESGNESVPSDTLSAISRNVYAPEAPLEFSVNGFNDGAKRMMRLSWTTVDEADLAGYRIYRSDIPFTAADTSLLIAESDAAFYDDAGASQIAARYFYAITAYDHGGLESALSPVTSDYVSSRPSLISPEENGKTDTYPQLIWKRVPEAAAYLLSVSLSENTGELWSKVVPAATSDTLSFRYAGNALSAGETFYWRVSTITASNGKPNGISDAWRFQVRN